MTFLRRDVLEAFGQELEDSQREHFSQVISQIRFSSEKKDAVSYEGPVVTALDKAGLQDVREKLVRDYYEMYRQITSKK